MSADYIDSTSSLFINTVPVPTGIAGDAIAVILASFDAVSPSLAGFTSAALGDQFFLFWKIHSGSEGSSYTLSGVGSFPLLAAFTVRGADPVSPFFPGASNNGTSASAIALSVNSPVADSLLMSVYQCVGDTGVFTGTPTPPGGVLREDQINIWEIYTQSVGAGATGTRTLGMTGSDGWIAINIVARAASDPEPPGGGSLVGCADASGSSPLYTGLNW